ncbi:MAG: DUF2065 domain-containing protein [Notoacmeibacter sp.]
MPGLTDFVTALGIVLVFEGIVYAVFPTHARSTFEMISQMSEDTLRYLGLGGAVIGVFVVWLARG